MAELTKRQTEYVERVERSLEGLEGVSAGGVCPTCPTCMERDGYDDEELHEEAWSCGEVYGEPSFSRYPCGICGCHLGGDRSAWHFILDGEIHHEDDACTDCVFFLANGDVPEDEYLDWLD